jgi:hypothetical protein
VASVAKVAPPDPDPPRFGGIAQQYMSKLGAFVNIPFCGNNGVDPDKTKKWKKVQTQFRYEEVFGDIKAIDRTLPLPEEKILEVEGSYSLRLWYEAMAKDLIMHGQDVNLWVFMADGTYRHIFHDHHRIKDEDVAAWVKSLTVTGLVPDGSGGHDTCPYDIENLADGGSKIMDSIGPKLLTKVIKGGTAELDGLTALHRIQNEFCAEEQTEIAVIISKLKKLSLKNSPTQDITDMSNQVISFLNKLDHINKKVIVDRNIAEIVADIFYVNDAFVKDTLATPLSPLILKLYVESRSAQLDKITIEQYLASMSKLHRTLDSRDSFGPAQNKPNKQDEQISALLATTEALQCKVVALTAQVASTGGHSSGTGGAGAGTGPRRCHKCNSLDHLSRDCPLNRRNGGFDKFAPPSDTTIATQTKTVGGKQYWWCPECGGPDKPGMWVIAHGPTHPTNRHDPAFVNPRSRTRGNPSPATPAAAPAAAPSTGTPAPVTAGGVSGLAMATQSRVEEEEDNEADFGFPIHMGFFGLIRDMNDGDDMNDNDDSIPDHEDDDFIHHDNNHNNDDVYPKGRGGRRY